MECSKTKIDFHKLSFKKIIFPNFGESRSYNSKKSLLIKKREHEKLCFQSVDGMFKMRM